MIYRFKKGRYVKDYTTLKEALQEFPELIKNENPDKYGIIYGIEEGHTEPTMRYLPDEGVWVLIRH